MIKNGLMKIGKILLVITILFSMFAATGANIVQAATLYRIISISDKVYYPTVNLRKGEIKTFKLYKDGNSVTASNWTIGSTQVAKIESIKSGIVTVKGLKEGTTYLRCRYAGQNHTITIKVLENENTTYSIYPKMNTIYVNDTKTYELKENNKTTMCTWQVSAPNVLKLEIKQGKAEVTGLKEGTAKLTAYRKW